MANRGKQGQCNFFVARALKGERKVTLTLFIIAFIFRRRCALIDAETGLRADH